MIVSSLVTNKTAGPPCLSPRTFAIVRVQEKAQMSGRSFDRLRCGLAQHGAAKLGMRARSYMTSCKYSHQREPLLLARPRFPSQQRQFCE